MAVLPSPSPRLKGVMLFAALLLGMQLLAIQVPVIKLPDEHLLATTGLEWSAKSRPNSHGNAGPWSVDEGNAIAGTIRDVSTVHPSRAAGARVAGDNGLTRQQDQAVTAEINQAIADAVTNAVGEASDHPTYPSGSEKAGNIGFSTTIKTTETNSDWEVQQCAGVASAATRPLELVVFPGEEEVFETALALRQAICFVEGIPIPTDDGIERLAEMVYCENGGLERAWNWVRVTNGLDPWGSVLHADGFPTCVSDVPW